MQGRVIGLSTRNWRVNGAAPVWALRVVADAVGRKARLGLEIEAALLHAIAEKEAAPRKPRGLEIIDPETGLPKHRNRIGRRRRLDREA